MIFSVGPVQIGNALPLVLIAGPCQIECRDHTLRIAERLAALCQQQNMGFIFKASFDKANRTSIQGVRGPGMEEGLRILAQVRQNVGCPVLTDVHEVDQCPTVAEVVDVLQVPALLCRQTDLLLAVGKTGKAVNIKKGQFLAPQDMKHAAEKVASTGNTNIMLCERGSSFGYHTLVNDFRALPIMAETGYPVVFDATHSVQQPGSLGGASGGQNQFIALLARAATAAGIAALFMETHPHPSQAPSDAQSMIPLDQMPELLSLLTRLDQLTKASLSP